MSTVQAAPGDRAVGDVIRSRPCPNCYLCGADGDYLHKDLTDRLFSAPGVWSLKKCRNASCGLVWLDPMPLKEDIGKAYEIYYTHSDLTAQKENKSLHRRLNRAIRAGYLAHAYGYNNGGMELLGLLAYLIPLRRAGLDFTMMYLPYSPKGRLLEVGCGSGTMLECMADSGWQAEGVDFDLAAVANSRRKGLKVHAGFLEDLRYPENCLDAITMSHLIEHVPDPLELLKECRRILKPGGRLVLVTPNISSLAHRIYGSSWFCLDPPRHLRIFTPGSLTTLLQKVGFRITKMDTTIRDACLPFVASRSILRTGRYEMGSRQPGSVRFWGKAMQIVEWGWLKLNREAGEEIAAVAQK